MQYTLTLGVYIFYLYIYVVKVDIYLNICNAGLKQICTNVKNQKILHSELYVIIYKIRIFLILLTGIILVNIMKNNKFWQ